MRPAGRSPRTAAVAGRRGTRSPSLVGASSSRTSICPRRVKNSSFAIGRAPVGLAMLGKEQNEIDVGGEVELAAAELAHADDHERLRVAVRGARHAVAGAQGAHRKVARRDDRGIGARGQIRERLGQTAPRRRDPARRCARTHAAASGAAAAIQSASPALVVVLGTAGARAAKSPRRKECARDPASRSGRPANPDRCRSARAHEIARRADPRERLADLSGADATAASARRSVSSRHYRPDRAAFRWSSPRLTPAEL